MKYMTATWALMGGILKTLSILSLSKILPAYLVDKLYMPVQVVVTGNKYCIFGQVQGLIE